MTVTIYCDTPCVRDLGALFGHVIKQPIFDLNFMDSYMLKHGVRTNSAFFALIFLVVRVKKPGEPASKSCSLCLIAFLKRSAH